MLSITVKTATSVISVSHSPLIMARTLKPLIEEVKPCRTRELELTPEALALGT